MSLTYRLWRGLDDYILEKAENLDFKVNVFTGPVLADDDPEYRGVRLPRQFWKVVAIVKSSGARSATAYLLDQLKLLDKLMIEEEAKAEEFNYGDYETYQVPIRAVEDYTGLSFRSLRAADPVETGSKALVARPRMRTMREVVLQPVRVQELAESRRLTPPPREIRRAFGMAADQRDAQSPAPPPTPDRRPSGLNGAKRPPSLGPATSALVRRTPAMSRSGLCPTATA